MQRKILSLYQPVSPGHTYCYSIQLYCAFVENTIVEQSITNKTSDYVSLVHVLRQQSFAYIKSLGTPQVQALLGIYDIKPTIFNDWQ